MKTFGEKLTRNVDGGPYPTSVLTGSASENFQKVLLFHVPPSSDKVLLDPTCGKRIMWAELLQSGLLGRRIDQYGKVIFADVEDFGYNAVKSVDSHTFDKEIDAIIYDPPFLFDIDRSEEAVETDKHADDFGDYSQSYNKVCWFAEIANEKFPKWLKDSGKLIYKCQDQYHVPTRTFYPLHVKWIKALKNFTLIDLVVMPHHNVPGTAWQVKDRPCSVINHTYFLIFKKREGGQESAQ